MGRWHVADEEKISYRRAARMRDSQSGTGSAGGRITAVDETKKCTTDRIARHQIAWYVQLAHYVRHLKLLGRPSV